MPATMIMGRAMPAPWVHDAPDDDDYSAGGLMEWGGDQSLFEMMEGGKHLSNKVRPTGAQWANQMACIKNPSMIEQPPKRDQYGMGFGDNFWAYNAHFQSQVQPPPMPNAYAIALAPRIPTRAAPAQPRHLPAQHRPRWCGYTTNNAPNKDRASDKHVARAWKRNSAFPDTTPTAREECQKCPDGECLSIGSRLHALGTCTPCKFFRSSRGCRDGTQCKLCHNPHKELSYSGVRRRAKQIGIRRRADFEAHATRLPPNSVRNTFIHVSDSSDDDESMKKLTRSHSWPSFGQATGGNDSKHTGI